MHFHEFRGLAADEARRFAERWLREGLIAANEVYFDLGPLRSAAAAAQPSSRRSPGRAAID